MKIFKNTLLGGVLVLTVFGNGIINAEASVELVKENLTELKESATKTFDSLKEAAKSKIATVDKSKVLNDAHKALKDLQKKHARIQSDVRALSIKCVKTEGKGITCQAHNLLEDLSKGVKEEIDTIEQFFAQAVQQEHSSIKKAAVMEPIVKK